MRMDDVARVVLALEAPHVAEEVLHYIDRSGLARVVATAADDRQLIEAIRQTEPDLVVAQPSLASAAHASTIVVLDGRESVGGLRAALEAGARGFFVWPGDRERLLGTLARSTSGRGASGPRGMIVAIRAARGGAGATFVATHLAAAVARQGSTCLLIDGDPVADDLRSAVGAPLDGLHTVGDLLPVADQLQAAQIDDASWPHPAGFGLLAAPDPSLRIAADDFATVIGAAASAANIVIVHLAKGIDEVVVAALRVSDLVLHVLTLDAVSFRATDRALEGSSSLGVAGRYGFIVNRAARAEITPGDVRRVFGADPLAVFPTDRAVERAQARGRLLAAKGRTGRAFDRLAARLSEDVRESAA
jgi:MinD-like ATPase involved in chromosome partitioning or flagellar assembly